MKEKIKEFIAIQPGPTVNNSCYGRSFSCSGYNDGLSDGSGGFVIVSTVGCGQGIANGYGNKAGDGIGRNFDEEYFGDIITDTIVKVRF